MNRVSRFTLLALSERPIWGLNLMGVQLHRRRATNILVGRCAALARLLGSVALCASFFRDLKACGYWSQVLHRLRILVTV